jgi:hypothetical protein
MGLKPRCCSTAACASEGIVGILYLKRLPPKKPQSSKTPKRFKRNEAIRRRFAQGETVADLASEYSISVQRVHQILRA